MKNVLIIDSPNDGVNFWRFDCAIERFKEEGVELNIQRLSILDLPEYFEDSDDVPVAASFERWVVDQDSPVEPDLIWTNDSLMEFQAVWEWARDKFGAEIVLDIDDHLGDVPMNIPSHASWHGFRQDAFRMGLTRSDRRAVATPFLSKEYDGLLAPNFVHLPDFSRDVRLPRPTDEVVIYCVVTDAKRAEWNRMELPLSRLLDKHPAVKVIFAGMRPDWAIDRWDLGQVIQQRFFDAEWYRPMLASIKPDIILSPLIENDFNAAKSNLKYIEAGSVRACFLGQRWGEYIRTVDEGVTGELAESPLEFADKLEELVLNPEKRVKLSKACREDVTENYTWSSVRDQWHKAVFDGNLSSGRDGDSDLRLVDATASG